MVAGQGGDDNYVDVLDDDTPAEEWSVDYVLQEAETLADARVTPDQQLQLEKASPRECKALAKLWGIPPEMASKVRRRARNRASAAKSRQNALCRRQAAANENAALKSLVDNQQKIIAEMDARIRALEAAQTSSSTAHR